MPFQYRYLPYKETGYFSGLVTDYLAGDKRLDGYYSYNTNDQGIKQAIEQRAAFPIDRVKLVSMLHKQYEGLEKSELVAENIKLLANKNTFTVCAAHQPNLLTGYLYFVYKILHAIKLSEELKKEYPDKYFVPVYYMGSEDNDLEELGKFRYKDDTYVWDGNGQKGAVGRMRTKGLKQLFNELFKLLGPPGANFDQLKDIIHKTYLEHDNIASATQYLVNELFGRYGLIVINPDEQEFKRSILPILKDELLHQRSNAIVNKEIEKLSAHYKAQAQPREINLFYLTDGLRERIERKEKHWVVLNTDISWTERELLQELDEHPERFSPNVILRGLLQESILPDVAFIGGGSEVAYWLQLKTLFEHYKVFYPAIFLRQSVLWILPEHARLIHKLGYSIHDIFKSEDELVKSYARKNSETDWQTNKETLAIEAILKELQLKAENVDVTLKKSAEATLTKMKNQLASLEKKMMRAEKRKMLEQLARVSRLKKQLFPSNSLQERVENFSPYFLLQGPGFFDVIKEGILLFQSEFLVVEQEY